MVPRCAVTSYFLVMVIILLLGRPVISSAVTASSGSLVEMALIASRWADVRGAEGDSALSHAASSAATDDLEADILH